MKQLLKITLTQEQEGQFLLNEVEFQVQRRKNRIRRTRRLIVGRHGQNSNPHLMGKGAANALAYTADIFGGYTIFEDMTQLAAKRIGNQ